MLMREVPYIEAVLRACQVERCDLPDVVQDVLLGAWKSMQKGRFRPPPDVPLANSIRAWLNGVAWRQASHYRDTAHRRREVLSDRLREVYDGAPVIENQVAARGLLEVLRRLPTVYQEVLGLVGLGAKIREVADELGISDGTANTRIQRGRVAFRRTLRHRRRAPKNR
ncbi:MAG TPA: sigma-70 family RNA polymerase sigma factor [Candidatus Nanopelagicales bacterium]|nr:sigma-70 family RNA polymerase sigma factor [Candidatus Nanopelagicales bacterium]